MLKVKILNKNSINCKHIYIIICYNNYRLYLKKINFVYNDVFLTVFWQFNGYV